MPIYLAILGFILSLTAGYWSFHGAVLYSLIGYLLGTVLELKKQVRGILESQEDKKESAPAPRPSPEPRTPIPAPAPSPAPARTPIEKTFTAPPPANPIVTSKPAAPSSSPTPVPAPAAAPLQRKRERPPGAAIADFFTKGNVFAKVGALLLFFGVSFLIKLVSEEGYFPLELRLMSAGFTAFVLIGIGWKLRNKNARYAFILEGTGFGIFYLTVFGAFRIWHLLPAALAFGLVATATVLFSFLAVIQNAKILAALALVGGFSAPVLISTGSGNHVALFTYYALLNLGIALIAKFRPWRELNLIGFFFTFGVGTAWGLQYYTPEHFVTVEPFLIFYFVLYVTVALSFSKLQLRLSRDFFVDAILVFGVPIAAFTLQAGLVRGTQYGLAISAVAMGLFYVGLATVLFRRGKEDIRFMVESFLASGICFTILAVPFALNNAWTSAAWALQGAFLVWASTRQNRPVGRYFGMALQVLASIAFFTRAFPTELLTPVTNAWFLGSLTIFCSCFFVAYQFFKKSGSVTEFERQLIGLFVLGAVFWWIFATVCEVPRLVIWWNPAAWVDGQYGSLGRAVFQIELLVAGVSFLLFYLVARLLSWALLAWAGYGLLAVFLISAPTYFFSSGATAADPVLDSAYLSSLILALSAFVISRSLFSNQTSAQTWEKSMPWLFLIAGFVWWVLGHEAPVGTLVAKLFEGNATANLRVQQNLGMLLFVALSALSFRGLASTLRWMPLASFHLSISSLAVFFLLPILLFYYSGSFFSGLGMIALPLIALTFYGLLRDAEKRDALAFNSFQHFSAFWFGSFLLLREMYILVDIGFDTSRTWPWVAQFGAAGLLTLLPIFSPDKSWPYGAHRKHYLRWGIAPLLFVLVVFSLILSFFSPGNAAPLPYIPVLNPMDLLGIFSLLVLVFAYLAKEKNGDFPRAERWRFWTFLGSLAFAWLTMGLIRAIHQLAGVPWAADTILGSHLVQAALSIFWGLLALFWMVFAHRKGWRGLWLAGTALMALVVVKLFLFDLNESGTLERVVSFIGAGVLLLLTGYFAPIPPSDKKAKESK